MQILFSDLRQKDVVSVADGKNLGKVVDVLLNFPENTISGITASGGKGIRLFKQEVDFPVSAIVRVGEDVVLVKAPMEPPPKPPKKKKGSHAAPAYPARQPSCSPNPCPPNPCPPNPCPPNPYKPPHDPCQPNPYSQPPCPPNQGQNYGGLNGNYNHSSSPYGGQSAANFGQTNPYANGNYRRDFDEYE